MKNIHRFFAIILCVVFSVSAWGANITISAANIGGNGWTGTRDSQSGTYNGFTVTTTDGMYSTQLRSYASSTFGISSTVGNITQIVFTYSQGSLSSPSVGNMSGSTWSGNAASITFSATSQARITSMAITYSGSTGTDPTITFNNGSYTIGGSALNLSTLFSSNSSGAVTYTVKNANGTGASISGTSFTATTAGTCTVQAAQAAQGSYNAKTVTADITVSNAPINVTLHYKGTTAALSNQTNPYTLPTTGTYVADACDAWTFDGWYNSSYVKNTSKPTYITQLTSSGDAYAVYKHTETSGASTPITRTMSSFNAISGYVGGDANISYAAAQGGAGTAPGVYSNIIRIYQNGGTLTLTANNGKKISRVTIGSNMGTTVQYQVDGGAPSSNRNISANGTVTTPEIDGGANSVTFTCMGTTSSTRLYLNYLSVTYSDDGGSTTYYSTNAECGPKVQATASPWVTSTQGATVKVEVPVTATNFDKNSTLSASVYGTGFSIVGWGANGNSVTKDVDLTTSLILEYNPTVFSSDATITFNSTYSGSQTPVYTPGTVHGRSLPGLFVIAIKNDGTWYALPADMSGSGTYAGVAVNVDDIDNPTKVTAGPATALYRLTGVHPSRYDDYGTRVRFMSEYNSKCLWSNAATSETGRTGINNGALLNNATSDNYEWTLVTTDGVTYAINTNVQQKIDEGRELRYRAGESRFGMYTDGNSSFRILPVDCYTRATVSNVETTYNTVTLTWTGKSGTDYNVYIDEGGVTKKTETNVTSPVTITGLSSETNYTWIISPGVKDAECALSGNFTTNVAPIHVTLSCDGTEYPLGEQDKPYTLPTTGTYVNDACAEWEFVGWTNGTYSKSTSAPTLITQMNADGTAYTVYKKTEAGSASGSLTMTGARTTGGGYNTTYSETEYTTESDAITIESNNIINNTSYIQLKAGTGNRIYNTTAMPGNITQITVTATTNDAYVYVGSSAVGSGSSALTPTSGSTSGTAVYTIPAGNTYFAIGATGSYVVVSSIEVEYSSSTSYYATSSECCNEVAPPTVVVEPLDVSATISWDNQSGATNGYHVTCSNGTDQDVAAGVTSLVISGLDASTTYNYTVTAKGATCNRSVEGSFTTSSCSDVPTDVTVTTGTHTATIRWTASAATATIVIYEDDLGANIVTSRTNQTSPCTIDGLNDNTDYYLQVLAGGSCPLPMLKPFRTQATAVSIAEWFPDGIHINLQADEATATVLIEDKQENSTATTSYADSIFISKYFEADSENKLIAIYNGTTDTIPLNRYCLKRSQRNNSELTMELGSYGRIKPGHIAPNEEIIFIRYAQTDDKSAEPCASTQEGYSNWYVFENASSEGNFLNFSGPMSIGLYSKTANKFIDVIGATTNAAGTGSLCQIDASNSQTCSAATKTFNDMAGFYTLNGDDQQTDEVETDYGLSTNRCLLIRKNTVKSGINAIATNVYSTQQECSSDIAESFVTLSSEWAGIQVGPGTSSGETHSNTCIGMGYVGGFDYNNYYAHFDSLTTVDELTGARNDDGTYTIPIPQLDTLSCTMLRVKVYEGTEEKASTEYKVPIMIKTTDATTADDAYFHSYARENNSVAVCKECDVVILRGATLTKADGGIAADIHEVRDLTIYPGGTLIIPNGDEYEYTVNSLIMRVEDEEVPIAKLKGTLNSKTQQVIVTRRQDNKRPYFFSLPYDCNVSDVRWSNGEVPVLGTDYRIMTYDGATRAAQGSANNGRFWTYLTSSDVIRAGVGYNIQTPYQYLHELVFPMTISAANLTDEENNKSITTAIHQYTNPGTTINNHNWNLIAQPYISPFTPQTDGDIQYGYMEYRIEGEEVIWERKDATNVYLTMPSLGDDKITYDQRIHNAAGLTLAPFMACFVQGAGEGDITFDKTHRILSAAPARHLAAKTEYTDESIFVGVTLSTNGKSDQTNVRLRPDFTNEYKLGYDLDKFITYYTARPQIYMVNGSRMAFRAVSDEIAAEQAMPIGVYGEYAGTYTFALSEDYPLDHVEAVYLIDVETGRTTNLLYDTYSFTTSGRVYTESRFKLKVVVHRDAPQTPTDIETVVSGAQQTQKIIYNGQLYILHDGKIYDATGKQLFNR